MAQGDPVDLTREQLNKHLIISDAGLLKYKQPDPAEGVQLYSPVQRSKDASTYYWPLYSEMKAVGGGNAVTYQAERSHTFNCRVSYYQEWPEIKVREDLAEDVEVAFPLNRGVLPYESISVKINKQSGPTLNPHTCNIAKGFYCEKNPKTEQGLLGNNSFELNWSKFIAASVTNPTLPWSWSRGPPSLFFPNFLLGETGEFAFEVKTRRELASLLRIRVVVQRDENGRAIRWRELKGLKRTDLQKYLENPPSDGQIPVAVMIAESQNILSAERERHTVCSLQVDWPYDDFVTIDSLKDLGFNDQHSFEIPTDKIVKAAFIISINVEAQARNCHSNYSSNFTDPKQGWDCVDSVSYHRHGVVQTLTLPMIQNAMREHFPSNPKYPGILGIHFCHSPKIIEETVGATFTAPNNKFVVTLADKSPRKDQDPSSKFRVLLVLQVQREVSFTREADSRSFTPKVVA